MDRGKKLLIVGFVLVVGVGLAWPFRKTGVEPLPTSIVAERPFARQQAQNSLVQQNHPTQPLHSPAPHVVAKVTSMSARQQGSEQRKAPMASFDLANHPALADSPSSRRASPVTPAVPPPSQLAQPQRMQKHPKGASTTRPAYATTESLAESFEGEQHEKQVWHVVENSDTLEKIAKRYLGDEGRALEIFDLNRDVLDNPYLLPIDAELRIPREPRRNK